MSLSPTIRSSLSACLELTAEGFFAFRKTPKYSELCHYFRLHYVYPVSAHLPAITISRFPISELAILFKRDALIQAMGNILEEN